MDADSDLFPLGLSVLVVDDNLACLKILERLLLRCKYKVTLSTEAVTALKMLRESQDKFDIVISDVHMPGMDGFKLLELIGLELDLPVIMLSANDDPKLVMKGIRHGAVDYLLKPVRVEELKNIWQHVIRKKLQGKIVSDSEGGEDGSSFPLSMDGDGNLNREDAKTRKRKEQDSNGDDIEEEDDEDAHNENEDSNTQKKPRVVWSPELHKKFVSAVDQLGPDKAFPKKILDFMNVEGLTRENVASHLQKYRIYLKRLNTTVSQTTDVTPTAYGVQDTSAYGSLLNPYGVYCGLGSRVGKPSYASGGMLGQMNTTAGYRSGLSTAPSNIGKCLLPNNQNVGIHFQQQNSNRPNNGLSSNVSMQTRNGFGNQGIHTSGTLDIKPHAAIPSLTDYSRCMENWQSGTVARSTAQQNLLARNNLPSSSLSGGYSGDDISHLQNALERSFVDAPAALCGSNEDMKGGQYSMNAQNVSCNMMEPQRWQQHKIGSTNISTTYNNNPLVPNIDSSNHSFGQNSSLQYNSMFDSPAAQISGDGISSFMQNTEIQDSEADTLLKLEETYLLEDNELLAGFTQNNCETLEDLVGGLLK